MGPLPWVIWAKPTQWEWNKEERPVSDQWDLIRAYDDGQHKAKVYEVAMN